MTHRRRTILLPTERSFKRGGSCVQNTYFATSRILSKISLSPLVSRFSLLSFHIFHPTFTSCRPSASSVFPSKLRVSLLPLPISIPSSIPLFFDICRFYRFLIFFYASSAKATSFDVYAGARCDPKRCDPKRCDRKQRASLPRDVQCSRRASDVVVAFLANGTK